MNKTLLLKLFLATFWTLSVIGMPMADGAGHASGGSTKNIPETTNGFVRVYGTVTDENGEGLPGVNILIKGTSIGTVTDVEGNYEIDVSDGSAVLVFSSVGYVKEEILVGNQSRIDIMLSMDISVLTEVVVVGYGTQRKGELTVAVSKVDTDILTDMPITSIDQGLAGRVAGLDLVNPSGQPGATTSIQIRGANSVNSSTDPLIVIDGFPVSSSSDQGITSGTINTIAESEQVNLLASINPNDIESIEVLKDAAATSIYGARGANGVILITTKSGREGKSDVSFRAAYSVADFARTWDMMNSFQYSQQMFQLYENSDGFNTDEAFRSDLGLLLPVNFDTDWIEESAELAPTTDVGVTISSGTKTSRLSASLGYFDQQGVLRNSEYQRYTARLKGQSSFLNERLTLGLSTNFTYVNSRTLSSNQVYTRALYLAPIYPTHFQRGEFEGTPFANFEFPLEEVFGSSFGVPGGSATPNGSNPLYAIDHVESPVISSRVLANTFVEVEIIQGLKLRSSFGIDLNNRKSKVYLPVIGRYQNTPGSGFGAAISQSQGMDFTWLNENTLTYEKSIGDHSFSALLGQSTQSYYLETLGLNANEPDDQVGLLYGRGDNPFFIDGNQYSIGVNTKRQERLAETKYDDWAFASFFGRVNYSYKGKYLFTGTVRRDGASQFADDRKWGVFPGVSFAWNMHNESFFNFNKVNELKLRLSWGQVGNHQIGNFNSLQFSSPSADPVLIGRYAFEYLEPGRLVDPELSWETTQQTNVGVDVALFNDRITATFEAYWKNTFDLLFEEPVPYTSGFTNIQFTNNGSLNVSGIEFSVNADIIRSNGKNKPSWNVGLVMDHYTIKVKDLPSDRGWVGNEIRSYPDEKGGRFYGLIVDGIFQSDAEAQNSVQGQYGARAGDYIYRDVGRVTEDGTIVMEPDGQITDADRVDLGSAIPTVRLGFNSALSYRKFDLNLFFKAALGHKVYNHARRNLLEFNGARNSITDVQNAWSPQNTGSDIQQIRINRGEPEVARIGGNNNRNVISAFVEDAGFLRLQSVSLGYRFWQGNLLGEKMSTARAFITAQNLFVLTGYDGLDPETSEGDTFVNSGLDIGVYPRTRIFTLGLNFNF